MTFWQDVSYCDFLQDEGSGQQCKGLYRMTRNETEFFDPKTLEALPGMDNVSSLPALRSKWFRVARLSSTESYGNTSRRKSADDANASVMESAFYSMFPALHCVGVISPTSVEAPSSFPSTDQDSLYLEMEGDCSVYPQKSSSFSEPSRSHG